MVPIIIKGGSLAEHNRLMKIPLSEKEFDDIKLGFEIVIESLQKHIETHPKSKLKSYIKIPMEGLADHKKKIKDRIRLPEMQLKEIRSCVSREMQAEGTPCCKVCVKVGGLSTCGRCEKVKYCSRECQKIDWPDHKSDCK